MRKVNLHLMLPLDDMISPLGKWMSVTDEMIRGHFRLLPSVRPECDLPSN
jgi:hypothetical protein